jgi:hypothetical protein
MPTTVRAVEIMVNVVRVLTAAAEAAAVPATLRLELAVHIAEWKVVALGLLHNQFELTENQDTLLPSLLIEQQVHAHKAAACES